MKHKAPVILIMMLTLHTPIKAQSLQELQNQIQQLETRKQEKNKELHILRSINQKLCDRLQRLRQECPASMRLIPDSSEKIFACTNNMPTTAEYKVFLQGGQGLEYKLIAENLYETNTFRDGATTLTWKAFFNTQAPPPRFLDITNLRFKVVGSSVPPISNLQFSIAINGKTIFTTQDLKPNDSADTSFYYISLVNLTTLRRSETCRVGLNELDTLRSQAQSEALASFSSSKSNSLNLTNVTPSPFPSHINLYLEKLFWAVFGRAPLKNSVENFHKEPLFSVGRALEAREYAKAIRILYESPGYPSHAPHRGQPESQKEVALALARRMYQGLYNQTLSDAELENLATEIQAGKKIESLTRLFEHFVLYHSLNIQKESL